MDPYAQRLRDECHYMNLPNKPQEIWTDIGNLGVYLQSPTLQEICDILVMEIKNLKPQNEDFNEYKLDIEHDCDGYDSYGYKLVLRGKRIETDLECWKREKDEYWERDREKKLYEELKIKYEGNSK